MEKIEKPVIDSNKIERQDVDAGFQYLEGIYQKELQEKDSKVTPEILESNISHTKRVVENAKRIAASEKLDIGKIEIAAVLHDIGKLRHDLPGGIDTFGHHETGTKLAKEFLTNQLKKSPELAESISQMIARHSDIPFIRRAKPDVPKAETKEDFVLRDADVLDMVSVHGLRKIVEIRQNPQSKFYQEDKGKLENAISSALQSASESMDILVISEAKKIAREYKKQTGYLLAKLRIANAKTLNDFRKVFDEFVKS